MVRIRPKRSSNGIAYTFSQPMTYKSKSAKQTIDKRTIPISSSISSLGYPDWRPLPAAKRMIRSDYPNGRARMADGTQCLRRLESALMHAVVLSRHPDRSCCLSHTIAIAIAEGPKRSLRIDSLHRHQVDHDHIRLYRATA
jgi:hypothetical protein